MAKVTQKCDFCDKAAIYDAKTIMGPWGFVCEDHYQKYAAKIPGTFSRLQDAIIATKVCVVCRREKPLTEFYKYTDHGGHERYRNECKQCNLEQRRKIRSNREVNSLGINDSVCTGEQSNVQKLKGT